MRLVRSEVQDQPDVQDKVVQLDKLVPLVQPEIPVKQEEQEKPDQPDIQEVLVAQEKPVRLARLEKLA